MGHTPGPWIILRVDDQEYKINAYGGDPSLRISRWDGLAVVYGCDDMPRIGADVALANASLIAAAPELLDALQNLVSGLDGTTWSSWQTTAHFDGPLESARAAIAKATGQ